mgnify:CR=1 FL=1
METTNSLKQHLLVNNNYVNNNKIQNFNLEVALLNSNRFSLYKILLTLPIKFKIVIELEIVLGELC